jgi:hypothetical protein
MLLILCLNKKINAEISDFLSIDIFFQLVWWGQSLGRN